MGWKRPTLREIRTAAPQCPCCRTMAYVATPDVDADGQPDAVACARCGQNILSAYRTQVRRDGQDGTTIALLTAMLVLGMLLAVALRMRGVF